MDQYIVQYTLLSFKINSHLRESVDFSIILEVIQLEWQDFGW